MIMRTCIPGIAIAIATDSNGDAVSLRFAWGWSRVLAIDGGNARWAGKNRLIFTY